MSFTPAEAAEVIQLLGQAVALLGEINEHMGDQLAQHRAPQRGPICGISGKHPAHSYLYHGSGGYTSNQYCLGWL